MGEEAVDASHRGDFDIGARREDDAVHLKALALAACEERFGLAVLVEKLSPQAVSWRASLPKPKGDEATLAREHFGAKLAAVFSRHGALKAFHDRAHWRIVCREVFGAVLDRNVRADTAEFVVRAFVGFLESPPTAHVVHENGAEICLATLDSAEKILQRIAALNADAALAGVDEGADDGHAVCVRESLDGVMLVFRGVLLVIRGHAHVFRGLNENTRIVRCLSLALRHENNDPGQQHEADHNTERVSSRTFLLGHSPLYDGSRSTSNAMFSTSDSELLLVRKSLYKNDFCGGYAVLYTLRGDQQYHCRISL